MTPARAATVAAAVIGPALLAMMLLLGRGTPTYFLGDFRAFVCAGIAVAHGADPYRVEPLRSCERRAGPPAQPAVLDDVAVPAPLPPHALAIFALLAPLPFAVAGALYLACSSVAMIAAGAMIARLTGIAAARVHVVFAAIAGTVIGFLGQPVAFVLAALAAAALAARAGRSYVAAAAVLAATIEPHVALPALAALALGVPRVRFPLLAGGALLAIAGVAAVGPATAVEYVARVLPAHALANAGEWQYSLTSVLTSLGVSAEPAVRAGEVMYAVMSAAGAFVALRIYRLRGDAAALILIPPAFAVFGGVHVHVQQIAVAFPAFLYVLGTAPRRSAGALAALSLAMIPWNVLGTSLMAGAAPLLVGAFAAPFGHRRGLVLAATAGVIIASVLVLANLGLGPIPATFHAPPVDAAALAETSWGAFSSHALARPCPLTQWLRMPTLAGLAVGLAAIVASAYGERRAPRAAVA